MNTILKIISNHLIKHGITHRTYTDKWNQTGTIYHSNPITGFTLRVIQLNTDNTIQITRYNTTPPIITLQLADPQLFHKILKLMQ